MVKPTDREDGGTRQVETVVELDAPVEAVWEALSDARELKRWFPMDARVTPGKGGTIWISWGSDWEMETDIEIWEPGRHLRTVSEQPVPEGGKGGEETLKWASATPSEPARAGAVKIAVDYHLEGKGGKTVLRLIQSGFGKGAEWDDEYDEVRRGWGVELRSLQHYLARHRGKDRSVVWSRRAFEGSAADGWRKLLAPDSGLITSEGLKGLTDGQEYRVEMRSGESFEGMVVVNDPPHGFAGTVAGLDDGFFRIMVMSYYGRCEASLWLATWGESRLIPEGMKPRWDVLLEEVLA